MALVKVKPTSAGRRSLVKVVNANLHKGPPVVTISGPIAECVLYVWGRKDAAQVTLDGPADAIAKVAAAPFGI
jgi:ribosomal protein L2